MMAFVGFIAQANGLCFPWKLTDSVTFQSIADAGSPFEQWDALPTPSKLQIFAAIGLLEFFGESSDALSNSGESTPLTLTLTLTPTLTLTLSLTLTLTLTRVRAHP